MNKKDKILWRNKWLQKLDRDSRRHLNCVRFGKNETFKHALTKFEFCCGKMIPPLKVKELFKGFYEVENKTKFIFDDFLTEIYSKNRRFRADVILFTENTPIVVEIACNEKESSLERKRKFWEKEGFEFIIVRV